ncbi:MAG: tail fiber domain-containing protein, partial [Bacteroidetes bacterium]|nr:tail fiber domain-containing protein [Bacteroidota bacterium]
SAMLDVKSTTKGMLVPRLTTAQRTAVGSPANGLLVFDTDEGDFYFYNGSSWVNLTSGVTSNLWGQNGNRVFLNDTTYHLGIGTKIPTGKMEVKADSDIGAETAIFGVVNYNGDTVFAVYPGGVRILVEDDTTAKAGGNRAGFAVGGFSLSKGAFTNDYLNVTPDSIRIYIEEDDGSKAGANKGGFAVGGFSLSKDITSDYFNVSGKSSTEIIVPAEPRVLWYPLKEAFLSGKVLIEDVDSVGTNSMATGCESKSIGDYSQAFGYHARAFGNNSTAIGNYANATGLNSYALGDSAFASGMGAYAFGSVGRDTLTGLPTGNPALALGDHSFAIGLGTRAETIGTFAFGNNSTASGEYSIAFGVETNAVGKYSIAMGYKTNATGNASFTMGHHTSATSESSIAAGIGSQANGISSIAMGYYANTSNDYSTAIGYMASTNMAYSTSIGYLTNASGAYSTAFGYGTISNGFNSTAMGCATHADGNYSTSMGYGTDANGDCSTTLGDQTTANGYCSTAIGKEIVAGGQNTVAIALNDQNGAVVSQNNTMAIMGGNVGIETVSPTDKLDVNGAVTIRGDQNSSPSGPSYTSDEESIRLTGSNSDYIISVQDGSGRIQHYWNSTTNSSTNKYLVSSEPAWMWDVTVLSDPYMEFKYAGSGTAGNDITWTTHMAFTSNGNVGIGTSSPNSKFVVAGGESNFYSGTYSDPHTGYVYDAKFGGSSNGIAVRGQSYFAGNVGIGTSSPANKLDVNGIVRARGADWPSTGAGVEIAYNGTGYIQSYDRSASSWKELRLGGNVTPVSDNTFSCGTSSYRWTAVWATDGTINTSDKRLKTDIQKLDYGLAEVLKLEPVSFHWKQNDRGRKLGLIAQDVQPIIGEVVTIGNDTQKTLGINYAELVPVLIKAIQELSSELEETKAEQKKEMEKLKAEIEDIKVNLHTSIKKED